MTRAEREIRAFYGPETIRVYQAYGVEIAETALKRQTFVSPPFSMNRMTWIKPSFLWMMYRSGWAKKDSGQARILAIDITHQGFAWALEHSCPSHPEPGQSEQDWRAAMARAPVRVQWDPERDIDLRPLPYRTIQVGLSGEAVQRYVAEWIRQISDVTEDAHRISEFLRQAQTDEAIDRTEKMSGIPEPDKRATAQFLLPRERPYEVGMNRDRYFTEVRERLLDSNHEDHEEIVSFLQDNPDEANIPYLMEAIRLKPSLDYLEYDDYGSYYKKCLWALRAIDTPKAFARIEECARSHEKALREEALYRLKRMAEDRT